MKCTEWEEWIYTFREISNDQQLEVERHVNTCQSCRQLFNEVESVARLMERAGKVRLALKQTAGLTDSVMNEVASLSGKTERHKVKSFQFNAVSMSRLALAAVSCGILILFFMEVLVPDLDSGKIKGPMTSIQGAIIKSEDFRKAFTRPKEKKSLFTDCKDLFNNQMDPNCVKEKLKKVNL